jgi:hypothetical protein
MAGEDPPVISKDGGESIDKHIIAEALFDDHCTCPAGNDVDEGCTRVSTGGVVKDGYECSWVRE